MGRNFNSINIPMGLGGINRAKNLNVLALSDLAYADGVTVERDILEKEGGASKYNTGALTGTILGLWDFISGASVQETIAYIDNGVSASIVTVDSTGLVKTLASGLATGGFPVFTEGWDLTANNKALYIANGKDTIRMYTGGATASSLSKVSVDWTGTNNPGVLEASNRVRMAAAGNVNFPHNIYLTVPGDHSDFTGTESAIQRVYPGEGEGIKALVSFQERLYTIKSPRGIYFLDDSNPDLTQWTVIKVTDAIGVAGPGCALVIENDLLLFGSDGVFYSLSQISQNKQTSVPPLLPRETADFIRNNVNLSQLNLVQSAWYGNKRQAIFCVPGTGQTKNTAKIILDMHETGKIKFLWSSRDVCTSITMKKATSTALAKPIIGDDSGFIYTLDQSSRNKNNSGYNGQFETIPIALFQNGKSRGNLYELEMTFQPQGNWDVTTEIQRDGVVSQTLAFSMQSPGAAAGSFSLDADVLAGNIVANTRHRLTGDARYVKILGKNNGANQNFSIMNMTLSFKEGNSR